MTDIKLNLTAGHQSTVEIDGLRLEHVVEHLTVRKHTDGFPVVSLSIMVDQCIQIDADGVVLVNNVKIPDSVARQSYEILRERFEDAP